MSTDPTSLGTDLAEAPPSKLAHYDQAGIATAIDALEAAMGGRGALLAALAAIDPTEELSYLAGLIADPRADATQLSTLCRQGGVTLGELIAAYKSGVMAKATVRAIQSVAANLPAMVEDIMRRAAPYVDACYTCAGRTNTPDPTGDDKPPIPCPTCAGTGQLTYTPDLDRQKLALTLTPFGQKSAPAAVVNVDNRALTVNDASPAGMSKLLAVTDEFLRRRRVTRRPAAPDEPVEGTVVSPHPPTEPDPKME